jgi:heme/copper-type cytochrome/quinol oxidase subunit 3
MKIEYNKDMKIKGHPYHMVEPSPWPIFLSMSILCTTVGAVCYMHRVEGGGKCLVFGLILVIMCLTNWWIDIIIEATYLGEHTLAVQKGIKLGMKLFIVSEVMFFFSFFWAFFHSALEPSIWIDCCWPPRGIPVINTWRFPLLNTGILLTSGVSITWAHLALRSGDRKETFYGMLCTLGLAIDFTYIQFREYANANFYISDGIYGSCFYMTTGFHGFHVIIGTVFIAVCLIRHLMKHFSPRRHLGFECAIWYWHFVDVVWVFLFIFVYWWGNSTSRQPPEHGSLWGVYQSSAVVGF